MAFKGISTSLLITTYNWIEALELTLLSVLEQTVLPNEIIIADDGSKDSTRLFIEKFKKKYNLPIKHVWKEDIGYTKTVICNEAIKVTNCDYIIQIDGDIILHKNFIKGHLKNAEKGYFLRGSRVMITENKSKKILHNKQINLNIFCSGFSNKLNGLYIPMISNWFWNVNKNPFDVKGCNISFWRKDLIKVNGYNEDIIEWGPDDSELSYRMVNSGINKRTIKFDAIQYHIYHPFFSRKNFGKNKKILQNTIENKITYCKNGIKKYE